MIAAPPPVLSPLKPCYVSVRSARDAFSTEAMPVSGNGFAPGERLRITVDGATVLSGATADGDGTLAPQSLYAPAQARGERAFVVGAEREDDGAVRATAEARVTALGVRVRPRRAHYRDRVRFVGRGFTDRAAIYAHYVRKGVLRRTVRLADAPATACGTFRARRRQFPFRPAEGVWRIQIDQHPSLTSAGPLVNLAIDVRPRPVTVSP